jgi:hypothetical protein
MERLCIQRRIANFNSNDATSTDSPYGDCTAKWVTLRDAACEAGRVANVSPFR